MAEQHVNKYGAEKPLDQLLRQLSHNYGMKIDVTRLRLLYDRLDNGGPDALRGEVPAALLQDLIDRREEFEKAQGGEALSKPKEDSDMSDRDRIRGAIGDVLGGTEAHADSNGNGDARKYDVLARSDGHPLRQIQSVEWKDPERLQFIALVEEEITINRHGAFQRALAHAGASGKEVTWEKLVSWCNRFKPDSCALAPNRPKVPAERIAAPPSDKGNGRQRRRKTDSGWRPATPPLSASKPVTSVPSETEPTAPDQHESSVSSPEPQDPRILPVAASSDDSVQPEPAPDAVASTATSNGEMAAVSQVPHPVDQAGIDAHRKVLEHLDAAERAAEGVADATTAALIRIAREHVTRVLRANEHTRNIPPFLRYLVHDECMRMIDSLSHDYGKVCGCDYYDLRRRGIAIAEELACTTPIQTGDGFRRLLAPLLIADFDQFIPPGSVSPRAAGTRREPTGHTH